MSLGSSAETVSDFFGNNPRHDSSRSGGSVFLIEVQYYLRLETGQVAYWLIIFPSFFTIKLAFALYFLYKLNHWRWFCWICNTCKKVHAKVVFFVKALFVPMPRHLFGELARTVKGCEYITQRKIVFGLLATCRYHPAASNSPATSCTNNALRQHFQQSSSDFEHQPTSNYNKVSVDVPELRAALWSLGHIGSTELGYIHCVLFYHPVNSYLSCIVGSSWSSP